MGIHFGVIAVRCSWEELVASLAVLTGPFVDEGAVDEIEEALGDHTEDVVVGGERGGASYLLDPILVLSSDFNRLTALSRRLQCTVCAVSGETVSGSFSLFVAEGGQVRRIYENCVSTITTPFVWGEPLPIEGSIELEEIDGNGLWAALRSLGFDFQDWIDHGAKRRLSLQPEDDHLFEEDEGASEISQAIQAHSKKYARPEKDKPWEVKVVSRRLPDGSTGFDWVPDMEPPSIWKRIKRLFGA